MPPTWKNPFYKRHRCKQDGENSQWIGACSLVVVPGVPVLWKDQSNFGEDLNKVGKPRRKPRTTAMCGYFYLMIFDVMCFILVIVLYLFNFIIFHLCLYPRLDMMGYHDPTLPKRWWRRWQVKAASKAHVARQALYLTADGWVEFTWIYSPRHPVSRD